MKIDFTYFAIDLRPHIRQQVEAVDALTWKITLESSIENDLLSTDDRTRVVGDLSDVLTRGSNTFPAHSNFALLFELAYLLHALLD